MQGSMARGAQAYYQTQVQSQSPVELVVMLYDGALRFMRAAKDAIERRDLVAKREAVSRTLAIVSELQSTLNIEAGGEVARQLDALYTYLTGRIIEANINTLAQPLDEAIKLLTPIRDAWAQIAAPPRGIAVGQERA